MPEYLQISTNGELTLPVAICTAANLQEDNLLKAIVEVDGSIRLILQSAKDRKMVEQAQ